MSTPDMNEMQLQIDALKAEVKELKDFVRVLYAMVTQDDDYDADDYAGGIETGRFNT
ncbi:MAG: hypothetical protein MJY64_00865 [archaeon]|nr:hypothetical protein [archaeon]